MNENTITEPGPDYEGLAELAGKLAELEYRDRRIVLELADKIAASHYE